MRTGTNETSCVHVADAAQLYLQALQHATAGSLYHGASGFATNKQIAEAIAAKHSLGIKSISTSEAAELYGDVLALFFSLNIVTDSTKAEREMQWRPKHDSAHFLDCVAGRGT